MISALLHIALAAATTGGEQGSVELPLALWVKLTETLRGGQPAAGPEPPATVAVLDRRLDGAVRRGLLDATLVTRFEVLAPRGHVRVPILDAEAAPSRVLLDGKPTSLLEEDGMYTVGLDGPGRHQVEVAFHHGHEEDRFSREVALALPQGGPTRVALVVPETGIEARLEDGTITAATPQGGGTLLEGYLGASGALDLSWNRRVAHERPGAVSLVARAHVLYTVDEAAVDGLAAFELDVASGETDRVDLAVPAGVEVTGVTGDAVLQWRSDGDDLAILLRHVVDDKLRVAVHFQQAVAAPEAPIALRMPLPAAGVPFSGDAGIRAPAGLVVRVVAAGDARPLGARDLPAELTAMSSSPVSIGYAFAAAPALQVALTRLDQVELVSTMIDEIEAVSVLLDDGAEVTKLRLHIRNNSRQYLRVRLPPGAALTHALLDGQSVRPAASGDGALLFSLRQSERVDPGVGRVHHVRPGDTLREIAHRYYSDPDKWSIILEANKQLLGEATDLQAGQDLSIPAAGEITVEEASFILELATRRQGPAPGAAGVARLALPELDVDALAVAWHVFTPASVVPLSVGGNLTLESQIRYGAFRRLEQFLRVAAGGRRAWAGGDAYKSILAQRRTIFSQEEGERAGDVAPRAFPLVGERHRFRRILVGHEQPRVTVVYAARPVCAAIRWAALLVAFGLTFALLRPGRRWWWWLVAAAGATLLLVAGHHVLGVHRRVIWGVDLALLAALVLARRPGRRLRELLWSPWRVVDLLTLRTVGAAALLVVCAFVAARFPLLLSLVALVALARLWRGSLVVAAALLCCLVRPASAQELDLDGASVRVPLGDLARLLPVPTDEVTAAPPVVLGAARYDGRMIDGALALRVRLDVTLGAEGQWKTVPLAGEDVVLARAEVGGKPIPVISDEGTQSWVTRQAGEVAIDLDILVPARGPRGSREFDFAVVRTPVTQLSCRFPAAAGIEPTVEGAVQASTSKRDGEVVLEAVLGPSERIHVVGLHDLGDTPGARARLYAETTSLLSVDEKAISVFSIIRYRILYAGVRELAIDLPPGVKVISADGPGGFRYEVADGVLRGETAFPIRDSYEISLRLERSLDEGSLSVPLPRTRGVERDSGWLAVEVPGQARLEEVSRAGLAAVDTRQLPAELVRSAVAPILRAYRYHDAAAAALALRATRLPVMEPAADGIDRVRAFTVVSAQGAVLTEMRLTLRNRLRQTLSLALPAGAAVRSTLLDGSPVQPSRDAAGALVLPLERSRQVGGHLEPITLHVVFEDRVAALDLAGRPQLRLPAVDLPVTSLAWSVFLPAGNVYSGLGGQLLAGQGRWLEPRGPAAPDDGAAPTTEVSAHTGTAPVRIELPKAGVRLEHERYWLAAGQPATISFAYLRGWLAHPIALLLAVLVAAAARGAARPGRRRPGRQLAAAAAATAGALAVAAVGGALVASLAVAAGLLVALPLRTAGRTLVRWATTLRERRAAEKPEVAPTRAVIAGRVAAAAALLAATVLLAGRALALAAALF